ncbi:MAG: gas vesicle protein [Syntrophomonas sp.]|nr:gas vesicle protein [Syntrophomonas sp.]
MQPIKDGNGGGTLVDVIDRILDKGLVINADIVVSIVGVELLGIKVRAALASFETAAKYGLEFPSGTNYNSKAWEAVGVEKEQCPQCNKMVATDELLNKCCPWCGWVSARAQMGTNQIQRSNKNVISKNYVPL